VPPRAPQPPAPPAAAPSGLGGTARWALAVAAPAVPLAIVLVAHLRIAPEVLRLALLVVVAVVGVGLGTGPAVLTALVAAALGWYSPDQGGWTVDPALPADQLALGAFGVTALVVAATAGARRGTAAEARWLRQEVEAADAQDAAQRQTIERLTAESASLRAEAARTAADLAEARADADRHARGRKAILDSLPPDLRAPHVVPPSALQLFPPLLTSAPLGVAPPSMPAPPTPPAEEPPPKAEWE
jgi:hypothetical protein